MVLMLLPLRWHDIILTGSLARRRWTRLRRCHGVCVRLLWCVSRERIVNRDETLNNRKLKQYLRHRDAHREIDGLSAFEIYSQALWTPTSYYFITRDNA